MKAGTVILCCAMALVLLPGCTRQVASFSVVSTRSIYIPDISSYEAAPFKAEGSDCSHTLVLFSTGHPNIQKAIDDAIASVPNAVGLINAGVRYRSWYIPYLYGRDSYLVTGTPLLKPVAGRHSAKAAN